MLVSGIISKINIPIFIGLIVVFSAFASNAYGETCSFAGGDYSEPNPHDEWVVVSKDGLNCDGVGMSNWYAWHYDGPLNTDYLFVYSCNECPSGYELNDAVLHFADGCDLEYKYCALDNPCDITVDDCREWYPDMYYDWTQMEVYEVEVKSTPYITDPLTAHCDCGVKKEYRCISNMYGQPTSASDSGACNKCPSLKSSHGSNVSGYANVGSTDITQCYMRANISLRDDTGVFQFIQPCYYTN